MIQKTAIFPVAIFNGKHFRFHFGGFFISPMKIRAERKILCVGESENRWRSFAPTATQFHRGMISGEWQISELTFIACQRGFAGSIPSSRPEAKPCKLNGRVPHTRGYMREYVHVDSVHASANTRAALSAKKRLTAYVRRRARVFVSSIVLRNSARLIAITLVFRMDFRTERDCEYG